MTSNFEIFSCPVCKSDLIKDQNSLVCEKGHCFDISADGYVNLLPVQKMNSLIPGDSKEMVTARQNFLSKGYYAPLRNEIEKIVSKYQKGGNAYDCGCGVGYYTENMTGKIYGSDISKTAVKKASKKNKNASFAVASSYDLPVKNESVDILLNIFSPLALDEFSRVIKNGGYFLYVVPAEKHLFEMKEILYENPYENEVSKPLYNRFCYEESRKVSFDFEIENEDLLSLFSMTPYFWRTPKDGVEKLKKTEKLTVTAEFYLHLLKKTGDYVL